MHENSGKKRRPIAWWGNGFNVGGKQPSEEEVKKLGVGSVPYAAEKRPEDQPIK